MEAETADGGEQKKMNVNGKSVKKISNSEVRMMKVLLRNVYEFFTNFPNTRSQRIKYSNR